VRDYEMQGISIEHIANGERREIARMIETKAAFDRAPSR
jgi:hypothetical protein